VTALRATRFEVLARLEALGAALVGFAGLALLVLGLESRNRCFL
jgi:hypothetical protein